MSDYRIISMVKKKQKQITNTFDVVALSLLTTKRRPHEWKYKVYNKVQARG